MPKRFTATEKWMDPWFRVLPPAYKCLWLYVCDHCDNSGVWKMDFEFATYMIGSEVQEGMALSIFKDRITPLQNGYWLINKFVEFQFGALSQASKPHLQVLGLIEKHRVSKGYPKGIHTLKDKDKEKDKDKKTSFVPPAPIEAEEYARTLGFELDGEKFVAHYQKTGWKIKGQKITDWKACVVTWKKNQKEFVDAKPDWQ